MTLEKAINLGHVKMGYKATSKVWGRDISWVPFTAREVKYKLNKWTIPRVNCGPLAVFTVYTDLLDFCGTWEETHIWECCFIKSKETSLYVNGAYADHVPMGTRFADAVMLTKLLCII